MIPAETIDIIDMPAEFFRAAGDIISSAMRLSTLQEFKDQAEKDFILAKLREHGWNVSKTRKRSTRRVEFYKRSSITSNARVGRCRPAEERR